MTFSSGDVPNATDLNDITGKTDGLLARRVRSTAGGTGVSTTETKDASGDLPFTAVVGYTYTISYSATAIAGAAGHVIKVNIRDGGGSSPDNADTVLAGTAQSMPGIAGAGRASIEIARDFDCPADIAAGDHTVAAFYVRDSAGATTSNVQLENAGPNRELSVKATLTN